VLPVNCAIKVAVERLPYFSWDVTQEFQLCNAAANKKWLSRTLMQLINKKGAEVFYVNRTN